jgi:hypothetical protein
MDFGKSGCAPEGDLQVGSDAMTGTLDQLVFSVHKTIASSVGKINAFRLKKTQKNRAGNEFRS